MFAHFAQETGNHNPSDKEYEEWRQVREMTTFLGLSWVGDNITTDNISDTKSELRA